ncbi:MAG: hypothetical protein ACHQJ7_09855 [Vicinamibacteria bacterium]
MKHLRLVVVLSAANFALMALLLLQSFAPARAASDDGILRGRGLQIVDAQGRVRASLGVLPATGNEAETVLLRLITERGRPSVKVAASESGSGMSLAGPTGTSDTYVVIEAGQRSTSIKLRDEDGKQQVLRP